MDDLTRLIAEAAEAAGAGRFVGLTLWQTAEGRWQASLCTSRTTCSVEIDTDPVEALRRVLGDKGFATSAVSLSAQQEDIFG